MKPLDLHCTLGQGFGENFNAAYTLTKGHTAIDESCGYGSDIETYAGGVIPYLYTIEKPDPNDGYTCIYIIGKTDLEYFELAYGHVSQIDVKIGDEVQKRQIIGKEGNKGLVFQGGQRITLGMQRNGDKRGSHRHVQKRVLYRVKNVRLADKAMRGPSGTWRDAEGFAYIQALPSNGYKSCVDFTKPLFNETMILGSSGYYVALWQKALKLQGFADFEATGFYGTMTFAATQKFQRAAGLDPVGIAGPKTRAIMSAIYKQF